MALPAALAVGTAITYHVLSSGEHPEAMLKRSLHSLMPDGTENTPPEKPRLSKEFRFNPPPTYESHAERGRKHRDLTEWEHIEIEKVDGTAFIRSVKSTTPKGLVFAEEKIASEAESKRREARKKLREELGLDKERVEEYVVL